MIRYKFLDTSIHEMNIHPNSIFSKERELARMFVSQLEKNNSLVYCPLCKSGNAELFFEKWGQKYYLCETDWSVNLLPLPDQKIMRDYFFTSELAKFRSSTEYQELATRLRQGLWSNLVEWIEGRVRRYVGMDKYHVIDWGSKFTGWINRLEKAHFISNLNMEEPLPPVKSYESTVQADLICLLDVIQRTTNPHELLKKVSKKLSLNGLLIITCRSGSGFDILTLREHSDNVFPLDHICLPSPKGIQKLLEEHGYKVLELTTPGLLDVEFVKNAKGKIPSDQYFQKHLISQFDEATLERMQIFLQQNNLSSHLRVVARRVEDRK
ncbi:hypothetical protein CCE28_11575 [Anaeromicrobium sediminis]|uniref:Methyltransferase type 11 domain-containing protein n=2 Tax=Anaeromicrobium sediminis TaxID=1478221 RepID=A0A267MHV2_9FIRM|nr:hypothetical protein CCE28_11575 [Anaeromicrobium sediminis]